MSGLLEKRQARFGRLLHCLLEIAALSEGVTAVEVRSPLRTGRPLHARQLFYWLARNTYGQQGWSDIGRFIGRNHASVINQHGVFEWRMQREPLLAAKVEALRRRIMRLNAQEALIAMRAEAAIAKAEKGLDEEEVPPSWYEGHAMGRHADGTAYRVPSCRAQNQRFAAHWRATVGEARWP